MKNKKNYLAIDLGASSGRAMVGSYDGSSIRLSEMHRFENKPIEIMGTAYWDVLYLFLEAKNGLGRAFAKYKNIESMALDTWGLDFGWVDPNGKLVANPISYRDRSKYVDKRKAFYQKISKKELFKITGINPIYPMAALFYLYQMKLEKLPEMGYAAKFLMMPDLFHYLFTGIFCSEFTIANNTMMLDGEAKSWDRGILDVLQLSKDFFAPVVMSGKIIGKVTTEIGKELGIKSLPVAACAAHDTASAVVGIPVCSKRWAFISAGTWCVLGVETQKPLMDTEMLRYSITNEGAAEGANLVAKNLTGFWIIQKCRQKWAAQNSRVLGWDQIVEKAEQASPFQAFIDIDDPRFSQNHPDMPKVIVAYCASTRQDQPGSIGQIARCVYESMVLRFKLDLDLIGQLLGEKAEVVHLIGGGAKNTLICQWTADVTGLPVVAGPVETTSMGNIIMQLKASGEIQDLSEGRKLSCNSCNTVVYTPKDRHVWDQAYINYIKIARKKY